MVHEPEPITLVGCAQDLHRMCGKQLVLCVCVCWGGGVLQHTATMITEIITGGDNHPIPSVLPMVCSINSKRRQRSLVLSTSSYSQKPKSGVDFSTACRVCACVWGCVRVVASSVNLKVWRYITLLQRDSS